MQPNQFKESYLQRRWQPRTETMNAPLLLDLFDVDGEYAKALKELEQAKGDPAALPAARELCATARARVVERAKFEVRGLDAYELAAVKAAANRRATLEGAAEALEQVAGVEARAEVFRSLFSHAPEVNAQVASRMEALAAGTVSPRIDLELAAHIARHHATLLWGLTDKIFALTDRGSVAGEPPPSGS